MPLSSNPERRDAQLRNLRRAPAAPAGNRRHVTHGGYAVVADERLDARVLEVFRALGDDLPLRGADGEMPPADAARVRLLAEAMCRLDDLADFLRRRGIEDEKGRLRTAALDLERRLRAEAANHADALGLSPRSRVDLGLDLQRAATSAAEEEAARAARERLDARLADLDGEGADR